jgi:sugar-specific transcriptional regulator TrmB
MHQLFESLNISANEQNIYLALAEVGKASAALLAKKIQIPRSSAYTALDALLRKGLISIEQTQTASLYVANKPEALTRMIEAEKLQLAKELLQKKEAVSELIPLLTPYFKAQNYSVPKLQFFEGTANVKSMLYDHCTAWQKSISEYDSTWWGYQDHHFVETYREWLDYYWNSMQQQEKICLFSNRSETEKKLRGKVARRSIKALPKKAEFSSTIWVLGDYVITIMTRQQPHYAFLLQDAVFAANQRQLFQMLWNET